MPRVSVHRHARHTRTVDRVRADDQVETQRRNEMSNAPKRDLVHTADDRIVKVGDRVFNYYDRKWGVIQDDIDIEGWFTVEHDDGTRKCLNGERISIREYA
jgi:hypothetical protein